jgi:SAM-dependent methyltransferase
MGGNMPEMTDLEQLKQRLRTTWMAGDFGKIAEYGAKGAEDFVSRIGIRPGAKVLDVACGTGNLAIPAARLGAKVTGIDIASNLIEQARQRASAEKLDAAFEEGDAEQLPYEEGAFDVVMTMFGAMFAPRPDLVASELLRVCRSGGTIAMANWTREGFVGKMFAITSRHVPPPPGIAAPVLWGDEAIVRERLGKGSSQIKLLGRNIEFDYPFSPGEVVKFFREYFGPTKTAFARLDVQGQAALAADLEAVWREHNQAGHDRTLVPAEYLEVLATRA